MLKPTLFRDKAHPAIRSRMQLILLKILLSNRSCKSRCHEEIPSQKPFDTSQRRLLVNGNKRAVP